MKILIGCECSGKVRDEFRKLGHTAFSCDILPSEDPRYHIQDDVLKNLHWGWDAAVFFPPCTRLAVSGSRWFEIYQQEQIEAFEFFMRLALCPIPKIAIENPVGVMSSRWRKPDQIIQPWQFGHPESKKTCLWLKGFPLLTATRNVYSKMMQRPLKLRHRIHHMAPSENRGQLRSITYSGIAKAMAQQWGN